MRYWALLGLGSNYRARENLLNGVQALTSISNHLALSKLYENHDAYLAPNTGLKVASKIADQMYVNGVVVLNTSMTLQDLHLTIKKIEFKVGFRHAKQCPLDIDILTYSDFCGALGQRQLPRKPCKAEYYIWRCMQDFGFSWPGLDLDEFYWQPMNWPEFILYQNDINQEQRLYLNSLHLVTGAT